MKDVMVLKRREVTSKGKKYSYYYIKVPRRIAERLVNEYGYDDEDIGIPVVVSMRIANWHELLDWSRIDGHLRNSTVIDWGGEHD